MTCPKEHKSFNGKNNHEETIKYMQEVIGTSWETFYAMEKEETLMLANDKQI
jgi:hypothetical protein